MWSDNLDSNFVPPNVPPTWLNHAVSFLHFVQCKINRSMLLTTQIDHHLVKIPNFDKDRTQKCKFMIQRFGFQSGASTCTTNMAKSWRLIFSLGTMGNQQVQTFDHANRQLSYQDLQFRQKPKAKMNTCDPTNWVPTLCLQMYHQHCQIVASHCCTWYTAKSTDPYVWAPKLSIILSKSSISAKTKRNNEFVAADRWRSICPCQMHIWI